MYLSPEPPDLERHYVALPHRQVHYRRAGSGPPVVALHQSPTSSAELATALVELARDFTVIAPDTPGYGCSDPLPGSRSGEARPPDMADYADALAELLDALGIGRCGVYGTHTGAMIAAEFGRRHPERAAAVVLDGYVVLEDDEREDILRHYFRDVEPDWAGTQWPFLWMRIRDQVVFFPWYRRRRSARMRFDVPPADVLQPFLLDFLRCGNAGRAAYEAAFRYPSAGRAGEFTAPTWLVNYEQDAIADHPERLPSKAPAVARERYPDAESMLAGVRRILARETAGLPAPPAPAPEHAGEGPRRRLLSAGATVWHALEAGPTDADTALVLLHEPGQSARLWQPLLARAGSQRVLAVDLPGHGESPPTRAPTAETLAAELERLLDATGLGACEFVACGWSAPIVAALAARNPGRVRQATLIDVPVYDPEELRSLAAEWVPDLRPRDDGAHLLAAWYRVRDGELFSPWFDGRLAAALAREPDDDLAWLHDRAVDLLLSAAALPALFSSLTDWSAASLGELDTDLVLARREGEPRAPRVLSLAGRIGAPSPVLPASPRAWTPGTFAPSGPARRAG